MYIQTKKRFAFLRVLSAALAVTLCLICTPAPAKANELEDRYNALQQQLQQQQAILNSNNSTLTTASQKAAALQESINLNTQKIDLLNQQIASLNAQIDSKNHDIAATQANIDVNLKRFKQELRDIYEAGDTSYISVLLESKDFTDFLTRVDVLSVVSEHNNKVINTLTQDEAKLNADQTSLKANQASVLSTKSTYDATVSELNDEKAQQNQIAYQATQAISDAKAKQSAINKNLDTVNAQRAARNKHPDATGAKIVEFAQHYVDIHSPYVFDTNGPDTFDCSGLTQWVYANVAGIALPHFADDQAKGETEVYVGDTETIVISGHKITSKSDLQQGDLVFFHCISESDMPATYAGHVGIYYGNGQVLAANTEEAPVEIEPWPYFDDCNIYLWGWRFLD